MDIQKVPLQGNARTLRRLYDSLQAHIWGLRALGVGEESYCAMLYPLLLRALPKDMSLDYNRKMSLEDTKNATAVTGTSPESPTENVHLRALRTLLKFIRVEVESRERLSEEQEDDFGSKPAIRFPKQELPKKLSNYTNHRNSTAAALYGKTEGLEC